jgi:hypothetical protein
VGLELRNELPDLKGFSDRNIDRMIALYQAYPVPADFLPPPVAKSTSPEIARPPMEQLATAKFWAVPWDKEYAADPRSNDWSTPQPEAIPLPRGDSKQP